MAERVHSVRLTQRGTLTLPKSLRERLPDETIFLVTERDDGVIELRPRILIDPSQAWFWSKKWQQMEREADEAIARGDVYQFDDADEFLEFLDNPEHPDLERHRVERPAPRLDL